MAEEATSQTLAGEEYSPCHLADPVLPPSSPPLLCHRWPVGAKGAQCQQLSRLPGTFHLAGKLYVTKHGVCHAESFWNYSKALCSSLFWSQQ